MFVCKKNSCRSQIAEGFARYLGNGQVGVSSAGLQASQVHPTAVRVMQEVGIDISQQTSDPLANFHPKDYDAVVSLCGCGVDLPQEWVVGEIFQDWQLEDPDGQPIETFRQVRDEIRQRVEALLETIESQPVAG